MSPNSVVCIHLAQPQKYDSMTTLFSGYAGNGGKWDMSVFSSYGSANVASGIVANMQKISAQYGKPFMQTEFGGPVSNVSSTESALVAYINALKSTGGQGIFYWEPECMSPFTSYAMSAWDSSSRQPTAVMNGFTTTGGGGGVRRMCGCATRGRDCASTAWAPPPTAPASASGPTAAAPTSSGQPSRQADRSPGARRRPCSPGPA